MSHPPRHDLYAFIHKGLRAFMAQVLTHAGRLDPEDPAEVAALREELEALLALCSAHLSHEDAVLVAATEARAPGSGRALQDEHAQQRQTIAALRARLDRLDADAAQATALYRELALFVAANLIHMAEEEAQHNRVLWAHFSDAELHELERRIQAGAPAELRSLALRWMLPHLTPAERAGLLGGMRQSAPPQVFEQVLAQARPLLADTGWRKLSAALAL